MTVISIHSPKVYGVPLQELPKDLYIPPDALEIFLETFEGPLDLLLYLIRKANINILDIPMSLLTAQYLEYVEAMRENQLELAAEYLLMAAMLLEIKSRMLLPKPSKIEDEVSDPRAELVKHLIEYERIKHAAQTLAEMPQIGRDYQKVLVEVPHRIHLCFPDVDAADLQNAWRAIVHQAKINKHHTIKREELSVRERMSIILRRLEENTYINFLDIFDLNLGLPGLIVSFLAMLELVREHLIEVTQCEVFAPIYIKSIKEESPYKIN